MKNIILPALLFLLANHLDAQLEFIRGNSIYRPGKDHRSGVAGAIADVNGDLYDDLIVLHKSKVLEVGVNQGVGKQMNWSPPLTVATTEEYALSVGDIDNDHIPEIAIGGIYSGSKFFKRTPDGLYLLTQKIPKQIYTQSANLVDYDNDGYLDYFACNDQGNSLLAKNNNGILSEVTLIDHNTIPPSDNSGNYGSEWSDVDNDGDMDLYIAKCKFGVTNPEDPRRHNMLFINRGVEGFTNEAEERGMKHKGQSWTGSFADFDNDGDQDCLITNHDVPHALMRNDGNGFFTEHVLNIPLPASFAFQSLWEDFDNNGFIDFLITGLDKSYFYLNEDGENFSHADQVFETTLNSASLGDINDDGFIDIAGYYGIGINLPGPIRDELFINKGNGNHYFKFTLRGDVSNAQGIGAKLVLFGQWGKQSREVHAGVSYGVSNTLIQHFGTGSAVFADSLVVHWPSGQKDVYTNIAADETYLVQEGLCMTGRVNIQKNKDALCPGDTLELSINEPFTSYLWSDGSTASSVKVSQDGIYRVEMKDALGCLFVSGLLSVDKVDPSKIITAEADTLFICGGEVVGLHVLPGYTTPVWSNGSTLPSVDVSAQGWTRVEAVDICGATRTDSVFVRVIPSEVKTTNDTVKIGETATLYAEGLNLQWYSDVNLENLIQTGGQLTIVNVQDDMTYYVEGSNIEGLHYGTVGETELVMDNQYSSNNVDAGLYLNVYHDLTLHSFVVGTDLPGIRRFILINYAGDTIFTKNVWINAGISQIVELDVFIPAGTYYQLKTDHLINQINFGFDGPRFIRTTDTVHYPYEVPGIIEIPTSIKGPTSYYYFYGISVSYGGKKCSSGIIPVHVVIDRTNTTSDPVDGGFYLYPNPALHHLEMVSDVGGRMEITDQFGRLVISKIIQPGVTTFDLSRIPAGTYVVHLGGNKKIIVVNK